jgi:DNA-binding NarL/FixJ family response regulator
MEESPGGAANGDRGTEAALTCVIADDYPALVDSVSRLLEGRGIEIVGWAADGTAALAAIERLKPNVAVVDVAMPGMGGIEIARLAGRSTPGTAVVLYTGSPEHASLVQALDAGVRGFVLKTGPLEELARAVAVAAGGNIFVDPLLAPTLVRAAADHALPVLSSREREILRLLGEGKSNDEIGKALFIAPDTVRTYIRRAMEKLDADTRTQAVAIAIRESFIA